MDNTEGSLTKEQKEILVGVLLGDGAMRKKTQALLEINHSVKQKELVDWLYAKFKDFVGTAPKVRLGNGKRTAYRFTTRSLPVFTQFYDLFFKNKKKIVPENLCLLLEKQLGIFATLNKDKIYRRIRIKNESVPRFMNLIKKFVLPNFHYKLLLS